MTSEWLAMGLGGVALLGLLYHAAATLTLRAHCRGGRRRGAPSAPPTAASVLKPVCGAEPHLRQALGSFCTQDHPDYEVLCGAATLDDPGLQVAARLGSDAGGPAVRLCGPATAEGMNRKVCNLQMLAEQARHDVLVISDSDIIVRPDYLARVTSELAEPGVGAVTCAYTARPTGAFWAQVGALGVNFGFLPSVVFSHRLGIVTSAYGGTIALTRSALAEAGGFEALRNTLADDYAVAQAVKACGRKLVLSSYIVSAVFAERDFRALLDKELRWARTIRAVQPVGYLCSAVTNPIAFAALAAIAGGAGGRWLALLAACVLSRYVSCRVMARWLGVARPRVDALVLRDLQSLLVYLLSFTGRTVIWRGRRMRLLPDGLLEPDGT